ncbi:hypothetical protein NDU88_008045 [Pleurodeles waltl]|uniref:Uncharacterized protein n=1 Tax=Pleurodeles waltl TaxID=8319 RepID=A0AAV7PS08_PLEWA|nr:hypothetical protein NDU88_008045 [Pleurodeles waltl]
MIGRGRRAAADFPEPVGLPRGARSIAWLWWRRLLGVVPCARGRISGRMGPRLPATPWDPQGCGSRGWGWLAHGLGGWAAPREPGACCRLQELILPLVGAGWLPCVVLVGLRC